MHGIKIMLHFASMFDGSRWLSGMLIGVGLMATSVTSMANLATPDVAQATVDTPVDLLWQTREWRQRGGMHYAKLRLEQHLHALQSTHGMLESQMLARRNATGSSQGDALADLPQPLRSRIGIYLTIGGHDRDGGIGQHMLAGVADNLRKEGWRASMLPFQPYAPSRELSDTMHPFLESELEEVDQAILIGFSIGAQHLLHWSWEHAPSLDPAQKGKIKLIILGSGVTRGSIAADWLIRADTYKAAVARSRLLKLNRGDDRVLRLVEDAIEDPWNHPTAKPLSSILPHIRIIQYLTLPEHFSSIPQHDKQAFEFATAMEDDWQWQGPHDGMVESAAQLLPTNDSSEQHIVRVWGAHSVLAGTYADGSKVTRPMPGVENDGIPDPYAVTAASVHAATQVLMDLLQAVPAHWLCDTP
jgi:hypothetical protein